MKNKLEIVIDSLESANSAKAYADSFEISINPEWGGITPTFEKITEIIVSTDLPTFVVIRPTHSTYQYTDAEFKMILHYIEALKLSNITGISIGVLKHGKIDKEKLEKIINTKGDLELVFGHAIDSTYDYEEEMKYLLTHPKVDYIQTTGGTETAYDGVLRLKNMKLLENSKLIIGNAINLDNLQKIIELGFKNVKFQVNTGAREGGLITGDISSYKVKKIKEIINSN